MSEIAKYTGYAVSIVALAVAVVTGTAVLGGFKSTNLVNNTTTNLFITGMAYFGTFMGVIVLAIVGKSIVNMFVGKKKGDA